MRKMRKKIIMPTFHLVSSALNVPCLTENFTITEHKYPSFGEFDEIEILMHFEVCKLWNVRSALTPVESRGQAQAQAKKSKLLLIFLLFLATARTLR